MPISDDLADTKLCDWQAAFDDTTPNIAMADHYCMMKPSVVSAQLRRLRSWGALLCCVVLKDEFIAVRQ